MICEASENQPAACVIVKATEVRGPRFVGSAMLDWLTVAGMYEKTTFPDPSMQGCDPEAPAQVCHPIDDDQFVAPVENVGSVTRLPEVAACAISGTKANVSTSEIERMHRIGV
ncbi:MAG: hypothetical protein WCB48_03715 [Casimicrobiaceae bacterium]